MTSTIALPAGVDAEKAKVEFRNGVLTLTIPKVETAKPRQIPISVKSK